MEEKQIAVASLPQQDGKLKDRPVLLLKKLPYEDDWLVCGISSKVFRQIKGFDVLIDESHSDFKLTRLPFQGLIRLSFLASLSEKRMKGVMGEISAQTYNQLIKTLTELLHKK